MIILLFFAFIAGLVTILSPCILPILPIVLSGSVGGGKQRPLGIVSGFIASFTFFTLFLAAIVRSTGLPADFLRTLAVVVVGVLGVFLVLPPAQKWIEKVFSRLAGYVPLGGNGQGFWSGLVVGLSLGLLWAPCVGPILASVITLAITSQVSWAAAAITLAYALGTAIPMLIITYSGRTLLQKVPSLLDRSSQLQRGFGVVMVVTAVALFFNVDRQFQTYILETFPQYGSGLTQFENNTVVNQQLDKLRGEKTTQVKGLQPKGPAAPELTGGQQWFNSTPLQLSQLKGKVVLVDFWTYSCINCIRTLPYLKQWHQRYNAKGLVIIGVHSPEFAFEKSARNVLEAIQDFGIEYPVVQDNDFSIWQAYDNQYWPAKYLIDAEGRIRYTHFGEGEYDTTERAIQALLTEAGQSVEMEPVTEPAPPVSREQTPETYLGYARAANMVNDRQVKSDEVVNFTLADPAFLKTDQWALGGYWQVTAEHAIAATPEGSSELPATLDLRLTAKDVYLVMGAEKPLPVQVELNGQKTTTKDVIDGVVTVGPYRLYHLVSQPTMIENGLLRLTVPAGVRVFAFTFGS